jgi:uncharacterized membrane protein
MEFRNKKSLLVQISLLVFSFVLLLFWLSLTPPGLFGKMRAIGYSVCHQIPSHSFKIGSSEFPICSRCIGMYLGVFSGILVLFLQRKKLFFPSKQQFIFLGLLIIAWLIDGINSFMNSNRGITFLYPPSNLLRFITGFGMGLCIAITIHFLFSYVVWKNRANRTTLKRSAIIQMTIAFILSLLLVLWENETLMKLLAYISVSTIVVLLTTLYTIFWIIILHKENSFNKLKEIILTANAGFILALGQIFLLDSVRLALTGTWASLVK